MDMPQSQSDNGNHQHHAGGHKFLGFHQAHGKDDDQSCQENVSNISFKDDVSRTKTEGSGKNGRHDQRDLAFRLDEADEATDNQQNNVNPENSIWVHSFSAAKLAAPCHKEHKEIADREFSSPALPGSRSRRVHTRRTPRTADNIPRN